jgi:hypothetical protein
MRIEDDLFDSVALLDGEKHIAMEMVGGITTATFFDDVPSSRYDHVCSAIVDRFFAVCQANPWLLAGLVKGPTGLEMHHPKPERVAREMAAALVHKTSLPISTATPYAELARACEAFAVGTGGALKKAAGAKKVSRITCNLCPDTKAFAFCFSLSHTAADGATYYKVLCELSAAGSVPPARLVATRVMRFNADRAAAPGVKERKFMMSPGMALNFLGGKAFGAETIVSAMYVDQAKVASAKAKAAAAAKKVPDRVPFVSTSDVVASAFGRAVESRIMIFAVNWRGRLPSLTPELAGNYEGGLILDYESIEDPASIRKTLSGGTPMLRASGRPLPTFCEAVRMKLSLYTSWAFPLSFKLPGAEELAYALHVPIKAHAPMDICIAFWAKPGRLACLFLSPRLTERDLRDADGSVLGENVGGGLFAARPLR